MDHAPRLHLRHRGREPDQGDRGGQAGRDRQGVPRLRRPHPRLQGGPPGARRGLRPRALPRAAGREAARRRAQQGGQRGQEGAALRQQGARHGAVQVQGLQREHLADDRVRGPAEAGGRPHPQRLHRPHPAPLRDERQGPRGQGVRGQQLLLGPDGHRVLHAHHDGEGGPRRHRRQDRRVRVYGAAPDEGAGGPEPAVRRHGARRPRRHRAVPLR
mmetsp:Transcript_41536/g.111326  ORF Transcript_41536/g.111326 Transcript_41536/m.111326 type:complete len:215 (+) Transcript_41536:600-1244(+)